MSDPATILPEFDHEMANTRRVLQLVPDDKLSWSAHPTLHTIGWNANHLAEIVGWTPEILTTAEFDIAPEGGPVYESPNLASCSQILESFGANVDAARQALSVVAETDLDQMWSFLRAGETLFSMPRSEVIRSIILNHMIHHRAHLCVYLRLNAIEVPEMYWPGSEQ